MPGRSERQAARHKAILQALQESASINVVELADSLGASVVTLRRDLLQLEDRGLLRRTHGGAVPLEPLFYEPFKKDSTFQDLVTRFAQEKRRIGRAAAAHVVQGSSIALTPGTTTSEVVRSLLPDSKIRVITNAINVGMELSKRKDIDVYVTGGHLRGDWFSLVGSGTVDSLRQVFVDIAFVGANGLDIEAGLTCHNPEEAAVNSTLVHRAKKKIAVIDSSKFNRRTEWLICPVRDIDILITDFGATDAQIAPFKEAGLIVERV